MSLSAPSHFGKNWTCSPINCYLFPGVQSQLEDKEKKATSMGKALRKIWLQKGGEEHWNKYRHSQKKSFLFCESSEDSKQTNKKPAWLHDFYENYLPVLVMVDSFLWDCCSFSAHLWCNRGWAVAYLVICNYMPYKNFEFKYIYTHTLIDQPCLQC